MKKESTIIPFPGRSDSRYPMRPILQRTSDQKQLVRVLKTDAIVHRLPNIAGHYDLINEQCDILMDILSALLDYMEDGDEQDADRIKAINRRTDALGRYHLKLLEYTSIHTTEFLEIARISVTLNVAIEHIKSTAVNFLDLNIPIDHFMLEIAEENLNFARALNQGFYKLATDQLQIEKDIGAALNAQTKIDKAYHRALAAISADREATKHKRSRCEYPETIPGFLALLKRREAYHSLFKSAKRLTWVVNRLQAVISHSGSQA